MLKAIFSYLFIIYSFLLSFSFSFAQDNLQNAQQEKIEKIEKIWYFTESERSRKSFFEHADKIDVLAPQVYFLKQNGEVESNMKSDVLLEAKNKNIKVMPLLANIVKLPNGKEYFSQNLMNDLLENTQNWEKIAKYMRAEGEKNKFYGWQLDLENVNIDDKDKFIAFVIYLENELDKSDLILSAALVSKVSDSPNDYGISYWNNWAGAYDYKKLGEILDFVSIMAYDQPKSPGPVATMGWTKKVMDYSLTQIPKEKISFGIPTYSWVYRSQDLKNKKSHFKMIDFGLVKTWQEQIEKQNTMKQNMKPSKEGYQNYWATGIGKNVSYGGQSWISYNLNKKNYTIWAEDVNSFKVKLENIKQSGVRGYSAWVLGDEDPKIWDLK